MLIKLVQPSEVGQWTPKHRKVFVAISSFAEKDTVKSSGFRWDGRMRLFGTQRPGFWWTDEPAIAARLAEYSDVDEEVAPLIRDLMASRHDSKLTTADVELPCPEGRAYLPFQRAGIAYARDRANVLIADEMGLGKTIQAIGVLNTLPPEERRRVLVVCPATLKTNWARELSRWLIDPFPRIAVVKPGKSILPPGDVVIINYDVLAKFREQLTADPWDVLIVDEAHYAKNPEAQRSEALFAIKAGRRLFLTGTPIVNRPMELFPLLLKLDPDRWHGKESQFKFRYTIFGDKNRGKNLEELQDILRSTVMVRRLKTEVLKELPPKRRQIVELPCDKATAKLLEQEARAWAFATGAISDAGEDDAGYAEAIAKLESGEWGSFEGLSELRHSTAQAKLPVCISHIEEVLQSTPKIVVFAHHRDIIEELASRLKDFNPVVLYGGMTDKAKSQAVDSFQNDDSVRVFIGSITAAGEGITLTASDTVIFVELDWGPKGMKQCEDRCHRIGSEVHESILVQHLVLEGSMDVGLSKLIVSKLETIEKALDRSTEGSIVKPPERVRAQPVIRRDEPPATPERDRYLDFLPGGAAQAEVIHRCLKMLAGNDTDYASVINGVGFNKLDGAFGHSLADAQSLSPKQAVAGSRLVRKYRGQLPPELVAVATRTLEVPV